MIWITENLHAVRARIAAAATACGREPDSIGLVAVSKKHPPAAIRAALAAGQRDFGENTAQEAEAKIRHIGHEAAVWHFIGRIQSNKTRLLARHCDWVHTVERVKIARRLDEQRPPEMQPLQVCIQVNPFAELAKAGVAEAQLASLAAAIAELPQLRLRGLMCLPPLETDPARQRANFARVRDCFETLCRAGFELDTLSMGMSADLEAAIAEGATLLRVGTAIFGPRPGD